MAVNKKTHLKDNNKKKTQFFYIARQKDIAVYFFRTPVGEWLLLWNHILRIQSEIVIVK